MKLSEINGGEATPFNPETDTFVAVRTVDGEASDRLVTLWVDPPATADATGVKGTMAYDSNYFYLCVDTDTWVRATLLTW